MAGSVPITGTLSRTAVTDTYPTHSGFDGINPLYIVEDLTEFNSLITAEVRTEFSFVYFKSNATWWQLQSDLTTLNAYTFPGAGAPTITITGDITGSGTSPIVTTLASIVAAGTKGTVARSATVTIDVKGRVTTLTDALIQIPEAQVTGLTAALAAKVDDADVGVTVCPLVAGLVPLVNLPPGTPTLYKGLYNATTNTPAILNGVGTAGDFYIANVIGNAYAPVNVTVINQIVAYNGAIWQVGAVFSSGISQITTASGVLTGAAVTLNSTAQINDSAARRYQTDLQRDIQNAAVVAGATAINRYALLSELVSVTVTNEYNTPELYEDGVNSLGEGTISTQMMNTLTNPITGVAYTTASMLAAYTFIPVTATAATWTYADVCVETAFRRMELAFNSAAITFHDNRIYQYNQEHVMPTVSQWSSFYRPNMWLYQGNSSRHYNRSGVAKRLWYRLPANQFDAVQSSNAYTSVKTAMYNMSFFGANLGVRGSGDTCVMIGATYGTTIKNCTFSSADTGLSLYFCLHARVEGGDMSGNSRSGIKVATGAGDGVEAPRWTGASLTNSASNGTWLNPTNINCMNNSFAGIESYGSDGISIGGDAEMTFEGSGGTQADHHIFIDGQGSSLVKLCKVSNLHLEQSTRVSHVCIKDYGQAITAYIREISPFLTGTPVLIEARTNPAGSGTVQIVVSDCPNLDTGWKYRQIGGGSSGRWTQSMCQTFDENNIYNPLNWSTSTIDGLTGVIPPQISATQFAQIIAKTN